MVDFLCYNLLRDTILIMYFVLGYKVYSMIMKYEVLVTTDLRGLYSLSWHSMLLFIKWKWFVIVCFYDILFKLLENYVRY